jgi:hypothetical protein
MKHCRALTNACPMNDDDTTHLMSRPDLGGLGQSATFERGTAFDRDNLSTPQVMP